jgi:hypothetical protein
MQRAIHGLFELSSSIKKHGYVMYSQRCSEFRPFLLLWDPALQLDESDTTLEAFRKSIGWKIPKLSATRDAIQKLVYYGDISLGVVDDLLKVASLFGPEAAIAEQREAVRKVVFA